MNILSIGGSDPSSGAGIQSDIKTFTTEECQGFSVITAITSQNSSKFALTEPVSTKSINSQMDSIFSDFKIDGIKIGMVYNTKIIQTLAKRLDSFKKPIILDPVIKSTTGGVLLQKNALSEFKKHLIPLAHIITPNVKEAEMITKIKINSKKTLKDAAEKILKLGAKNVVITGFEEKNSISDYGLTESEEFFITTKKIKQENHGSGCNYSAALLIAILERRDLKQAVFFAKQYAYNAIKNAKKTGKGIPITHYKKTKLEKEFQKAINELKEIKNIFSLIPECQTNFVYAKEKPKTIKNIMGINGRIVKTGKEVTVAGNVSFGGSKHVATAVLEMNKKFPSIRSAINIKFDKKTIQKFSKLNMTALRYNRQLEPKTQKKVEGNSISWGIKNAIKTAKTPPDAVFHEGDFGKEPMILVFGESPHSVIEKVSKIV